MILKAAFFFPLAPSLFMGCSLYIMPRKKPVMKTGKRVMAPYGYPDEKITEKGEKPYSQKR